MKSSVVWDITACSPLEVNQHVPPKRRLTFYQTIQRYIPEDSGRAVAQAVSRCLPTAASRVRVRAACGVCGGQGGIGAGFLRVLRFPLPIILPVSPSS
jgi:hypothetical protein